MILTDREIQIAISKEQIIIDPPPRGIEYYSSTSVDLTLDRQITEFRNDLGSGAIETIIDPNHKDFIVEGILEKLTRPVEIDSSQGYLLRPKQMVLGWTAERVVLPIHSRLAARVEGKSSLARLGLGIHVTAPTIHSGFKYRIRLEMVNHGALPIRLRSGMRICQLIFELTFGTPQKGFEPNQTALPSV